MSKEFFMESIPQVAWWKQNDYSKSIKPLDKMPIKEIRKLYESGFILCDVCGKKIPISECKYSLLDHILHIINSRVLWSCEGCLLTSKRNGEIIGECGDWVMGDHPFCSNCNEINDYEYEMCRDCIKKYCKPLDILTQIEERD